MARNLLTFFEQEGLNDGGSHGQGFENSCSF